MANYKPGKETKNIILKVSKELFYKHGFKNTTYAQVSKRSNVNIGLIVYHFKSLENIANIIYRQILKERHIIFLKKVRLLDLDETVGTGILALVEYWVHTKSYLEFPNYQRFISEVLFQSMVWDYEQLNDSLNLICAEFNITISKEEAILHKYIFLPYASLVTNSINSNLFKADQKLVSEYHTTARLSALGLGKKQIREILEKVDAISSQITISIDNHFNFY